MAKYYNIFVLLFAFVGLISCNRSAEKKSDTSGSTAHAEQDILTGTMSVLVDESVLPLVKEQVTVFESSYPQTTLRLVADAERVAINRLLKGEAGVAVLKRTLTPEENKAFQQRDIAPRIFPLAYDAVALVARQDDADTSINNEALKSMLLGESGTTKKLILDNVNGSSLRLLKAVSGVDRVQARQVEEAGDAIGVIRRVLADQHAIGVLSYNQYLTLQDTLHTRDKVRTLSVRNEKLRRYYRPSQSALADDTYPFKQEVYILNYQASMGLGVGFSAFVTGDRGQRIVLKSGLLPATMPGRELIIRDEANF